MITGKHLIAGQWVAGDTTFSSQPAHGPAADYAQGTEAHIDAAAKAAEAAFWSYGYSTAESRAKFLNAIADEIEARGEALTAIGTAETGLPEARLNGERGRTTGQLRLFASHILDGAYLDRRHDKALPDRAPLPRPDIKMVERPVGPVGVLRRIQFPAGVLDRGRRHRVCACSGLPGGGQGPSRPSGNRRNRCPGNRCGDQVMRRPRRRVLAGPVQQPRGWRSTGHPSADPGRRLHRIARSGQGAV